MPSSQITRRTFAATASGFAAGVFATAILGANARVAAGQATPIASVPAEYVSTRLRTLSSPDFRDQVNAQVLEQFIPEIETLNGYRGYVLGDVVDHDDQSLAISVMSNVNQQAAFDAASQEFVAGLGELSTALETQEWKGDLQIAEGPATTMATPVAMSGGMASQGYVTVRIYRSGSSDPRGLVPELISGFLPITSGIPGFEGYLWYLTDEGFVAISLFDSIESADASTEAARDWAAENATAYFEGDPIVINANVVYANLPVLR